MGNLSDNNKYFLIVTCDLFDKCYHFLDEDKLSKIKSIMKKIIREKDIIKTVSISKKIQASALSINIKLYVLFMFFYRKVKKNAKK